MIHDVVIIGAGPAGLTAAIYAARARLKTLSVESYNTPGQAVVTSDIENYPGFPQGLNGFELIDRFRKQAKEFGAEFKVADIENIDSHRHEGRRAWKITGGSEEIVSLSVIVATGARPKKLGLAGEDTFHGKGVSYCATCDAALFKGKSVAVMGGGNTAIEEALFLTKFANKVSVVHRRDRLRATKILEERALANKKIEFVWDSAVSEIVGSNRVESLKIKNVKTGKVTNFACDGIFIFVGYAPNTEFVKRLLKLDKDGYIVTDEDMKTPKSGIFACGDARKKLLRQVVTAAGDGATAAFSAGHYVEELKGIAYK